jgi:hypothetical protein
VAEGFWQALVELVHDIKREPIFFFFLQWVVGKLDGHREVFSLLQAKNANLTDAGEEVAKLGPMLFKLFLPFL